jgi:uncharacterized protein YndB with AHSA1/START domain
MSATRDVKPSLTLFRKTFNLPADARRTFETMTQPQHLATWFSDHVEVELRVGGRFRFWGRRVPWTPRQSDADQVITRFEPPSLLGFRWTWRGCPGEATLELRPLDSAGTQLVVHHAVAGQLWPAEGEDASLIGDFWKLFAGNLRSYLRTGTPAIDLDLSPRSGDVTLSIDVDAPAARVFHALSDPATMNRWLSRSATVDLRAGGEYSYGWTTIARDGVRTPAGPTRLIEVVPDRLLVHDWRYGDEPLTRVRWELSPLGADRTRVTITHTKFDDETMHGGYAQGWSAFLVALKELSESSTSAGASPEK